MNISSEVLVCSGVFESFLVVCDFVLINLFGSEKLVGQIVDVVIYIDVPQAERNAVVDDGVHMFLLCLWTFV